MIDLALPPTATSGEVTHDVRLRWLVEAHFDAVWGALRRLGVPEGAVDDGVQKVFLVASRRLDEIRDGGERRYLLGVALRVASDMRRALRRRREVPMDASVEALHVVGAPDHPDELLESKQALAELAACLDAMPGRLREAFVLFELEELSAPEVAQILGVPLGTVASRVRRARDYVRKALAGRGKP